MRHILTQIEAPLGIRHASLKMQNFQTKSITIFHDKKK